MRALLKAGAVVTVLAAGLASCSDGGEKKAGPPKPTQPSAGGQVSPGQPIGTRPLAVGSGVKVDLMALDRVSPKAVVARWRVRNDLTEEYAFGPALSVPWNSSRLNGQAIDGVSVVDAKNGTRAFPMSYTNRECMCTRGWQRVRPKSSLDLVAVFPAPPADVTQMDVLFPTAPPFLDVPLGNRAAEPLRVDGGGSPVDPNSSKAGEPQIFPITVQVDDATKALDDDGNDLRVRLSTDVLFALNKADLNAKAQAALKDVAAKIDRSAGSTVKVDGHTDNSGNDAINDPLSERRAQAVKAALERLVTRQGVTYEVKGHGSKDPIAKNDNPEGRRLNRRVTIVFTKPKSAPAAAPSSASSPVPGAPSGELPVIATSRSGTAPWMERNHWPKQAEVDINELKRDRHGYVSLTWTVRNNDARDLNVWRGSQDYSGIYAESSTSGAALVSGEQRHRVLRDAKHRVALGPNLFRTARDEYLVKKGEKYTLWAMFRLPLDVTTVTVDIPGFTPVPNVPVR